MVDTGCSKPRLFAGAWGLLIVLCLSRALAFAARTHVVPFYPDLMERMGVGYTAIGVIYSAYMLAYALSLTPAGIAADRYSPRVMMGLGFTLMAAGTFVLALVPWFGAAIAARAVQGVGTALVYACSLKLVAVTFPRGERGKALSAIEVVIGAGMLVTLTLFPVLSRWISMVTLFTFLGGVLLAGLLLLPLLPRNPMGRAVGVVTPGAPPQAFRQMLGRPLYLLAAVAFLGLFVVNGFFGWLPIFFAEGLGLGKDGGGFLMAVLLISEMTAAPLAGYASDRWGRRLPAIQVGGVALVIACLLAIPGSPGIMAYVVAISAGVAVGWAISPLQALATEAQGAARAGLVTSITSAAGQAGGVLAGVTLGWVIDTTGSFRYVWALCLVMALLRLLVASFIREGEPLVLPGANRKEKAVELCD